MAEGNWQCGMCAAYNEPSKHACMVCETFRVLGTRGADLDLGDLLASTQSMFGAPGEEPVTVPPPERADDPPQVRVMEPPPARAGSSRSGGARPDNARSESARFDSARPATVRSGTEPPATERPDTEWPAAPNPGPKPDRERREPRERQTGVDTEPVPLVTDPLEAEPRVTGPRGPVTEPRTMVTERARARPDAVSAPGRTARGSDGADTTTLEPGHRSTGRWSLPRWPQGTVRALALAAVGGAVLVSVWVFPDIEGGGAGPAEGEREGDACPERIAALMPGTGPGALVESFETERHRIVLCANSEGELYYFGEFLDDGGETMVVPAVRTEEGYVADAGQTRYEIGGGVVVITGGDGTEIARLPLDSVPAPE